MKTNKWLSGILLAVAFLMCGASFADTYKSDGILAAAPTGTVFVITVEPPLVPAIAMATDGSENDNTVPCMASCNKITDSILSKWRYGRTVMFAYSDTVTADKVNVLACGYSDIPKDKPYRVPIAV